MNIGNWDDEDEDIQFSIPTAGAASSSANADIDDLIQFSDSLTLQAEQPFESDYFNGDGEDDGNGKSKLPPLPSGVIDLTLKRGVLLEKHTVTETLDSNDDKNTTTNGTGIPENGKGDANEDESDQEENVKNLKPSHENPFVEFHYDGYLISNGERFDSSRDQNYPMIVQLDIPPTGQASLIAGLELGLRELSPGDKATLTITSEFGYGEKGADDIPPNSDLKFHVEIIDVRPSHRRRLPVVDTSKTDLSRLEEIRKEREIAQQRRVEEASAKDAEKKRKADRAAALREKLANKNKGSKGGKKGGKKKK